MFRVEALPAGPGDALLLEWGPSEADVHRMLIDGGVGSTYPTLRERLSKLPTDDKGRRRIDLLVITHIDNDHIEGIIRLLCDNAIRLAPADVWFNGWPQVRRPGPGDLGAKEGEWLGALLERGRLPWNKAFARRDRRRVEVPRVPVGVKLPRRTVAGLELVLVSPTPTQLDALRDEWEEVVLGAGGKLGDVDAAIRQLEEKGRLLPVMLGSTDPSVSNKSSIAFTATYGNRCALLTGDGDHVTIAESLRKLAREDKVPVVKVHLFKLCHHGSRYNIGGELLDAMSCKRFLVCTNGAGNARHPNKAAIDLIINSVPDAKLIFNYRTATTTPWSRRADQETRKYTVRYPQRGTTVIDV